MPSMQVWFTWNMRTSASCAQCERVFEVPEACVQGVLIYEGRPSRRFRWHPNCYVEQGLAYLEDHPPVEGPRGKKPSMGLSLEQLALRHALVARKSRLKKKKLDAIEYGFWWKMKDLEQAISSLDKELGSMEASVNSSSLSTS